MTEMARDFKQVETVSISLLDILRHDFFAEGFIEVAKGQPFNSLHADNSGRDAWFYERGRLVATEARNAYGRVPALWQETNDGHVINPKVLNLAGAMFMTGAMT